MGAGGHHTDTVAAVSVPEQKLVWGTTSGSCGHRHHLHSVGDHRHKSVVQKCTSTDSHSPQAFSVNNQTHKAHKNKPIFTALHCCLTKHFKRQTKAPTALEIRDFVPIQEHKLYSGGSCETLFKFRFVFSFAYL